MSGEAGLSEDDDFEFANSDCAFPELFALALVAVIALIGFVLPAVNYPNSSQTRPWLQTSVFELGEGGSWSSHLRGGRARNSEGSVSSSLHFLKVGTFVFEMATGLYFVLVPVATASPSPLSSSASRDWSASNP